MLRALRVSVLLVAPGCASTYAYIPTTHANAIVHGRAAAEYPIPAGAPQGSVWITSYGLADVSPESVDGGLFHALHLRVVLADNGATPWTFDTREQRLELHDGTVLPAAFVSANAGAPPPLMIVEPQHKRVVDLSFLLPPALQDAEEIPEFDAVWRVTTNAGAVVERTPFERLVLDADEGYYDDWDFGGGERGGPYWINPALPRDGVAGGIFEHGVVIRPSLPGGERRAFHDDAFRARGPGW